MHERRPEGLTRALEELPPHDAAQAAEILAGCPVVQVSAGAPYFSSSFQGASLLLVDEGFSVIRVPLPHGTRSIITCEAGPGRVMLPPTQAEVLFGLADSRLIAIPQNALDQLLLLPSTARDLFARVITTLRHEQEALGTFAHARHLERVRRKLFQLARSYGRVGRDGIRIDFPVSHTVLAEMIGSSRETVTRALDELQRAGFVARRGHTYRLLISPYEV
jgi:Crp-like helix-turn-helix domain